MANQNRRPGSTQTARKGSEARRGQSTARTAATSARSRSQGSAAPAKTRTANGTAAAAQTPGVTTWTPRWLRWTTLVLSLIGVGLSIYLTISHLNGGRGLICSNKGTVNCEAVTTSPESEVFGIFPVAELGLAFYAVMMVLNLPWAWRPEWRWLPGRGSRAEVLRTALPLAAWRVRLASVIIGVLFILYLVYTELITLRTICLWCTYVHITTFILFVILIAQAAFWGSPAKAAADGKAGRSAR